MESKLLLHRLHDLYLLMRLLRHLLHSVHDAGFLDASLHHLFHGRITYLDSSRVLDAELRQLLLLFHDEGLQHPHRGTTILMQLLLAGVLLLQQVELMAELRLVLLKLQDFAGRLLLRGNSLLQQHPPSRRSTPTAH